LVTFQNGRHNRERDHFSLNNLTFIFLTVGDTIRQLFDKAVITKQLSVVEAYGLLLFRVDKGQLL
jgi:hypothetical protein